MLEKTTRGLKLFAGVVLLLLVVQTLALGAIWQQLDRISGMTLTIEHELVYGN